MRAPTAEPPPLPRADQHSALFLDVDGTLLAIAERPDLVAVAPATRALLAHALRRSAGALALISGRSIAELDRLFRPLVLPIAGQHGAERRDAQGRIHVHRMYGAGFAPVRGRLEALTRAAPGLLIEDKGLTLAVHYRLAPAAREAAEALLHEFLAASGDAYRLQPGKMVLEVKPAGRDKGSAIDDYLAEAPFRGRRPVFIGDDVTDEYGFAAVNARGGISVKVGDGDSAARWRLPDVAAVLDWLRTYAGEDGTRDEQQS
jgi:trehalose 6-phosphate phosphatase